MTVVVENGMKISYQVVLAFFSLFLSVVEAQAAEEWIYPIKQGDTLISIANVYLPKSDDWKKLQRLNRVPEPRHLNPGTSLRIPVAWLKQEASVAEIVRVHGDAWKVVKDAALPLSSGGKLLAGDTVRTGVDSNLTLRFVDGSRLLVAQNSSLTLTRMMIYGKTGMAQTAISLHEGGVETQVTHQKTPAAKYEIESQALNLGVRGTDFRVGVDAAGLTRSEVLGGRVMAAGQGVAVRLDAGFGTLAARGKAPAPPISLPEVPNLGGLPSRLERVPLRFNWEGQPGIRKYRAQVFANRAFDTLLLDGVFQDHAAKWQDLPDGKYVLRVRGIDGNGLEGLNADHDFVLKARPEPPLIAEPQDGKRVYGTETTFRWTKPANTQNYHLQLSDTAEFTRLLFDLPNIDKIGHTLALAPGQYYWRVASVTAEGEQGPYSDAQGFIQRKVPESPVVAPPQMDDGRLTFRWKAGEAGQKFQIQLARDAAFQNVVSDTLLSDSQFSMAQPEGGTYFMRIKAIDSDGFAGAFGQVQQVEVPSSFPGWAFILIIPFLLVL
jgi:hypothetical protein